MHPAIFELKKRLEECYGERLVRFIVFGSYIRGENTPESDIDILVTLKGEVDSKTEIGIWEIALDVDLDYDVVFDVKVFSEDEIQNSIIGATPFVENVFAEGISP